MLVASFAEAWIEINLGKNENEGEQSRLLRGGVDLNFFIHDIGRNIGCRLLRGGVD